MKFLEPGENWLVVANALKAGETLCFNRGSITPEDVTKALDAQCPDVNLTYYHGVTTYIEKVEGY